MASEEKKHLEMVLKPFLKEQGFRKKGASWWKHTEDFIQVINIQGSQWSKKFYINLAVYIRSLGDEEWPTEYKCHIRNRLESLVGDSKEIISLLDYEDFAPDELERKRICEILKEKGIPWLNKCSSYNGAKEEYALPNRVMTKWQRDLLDEYFA
jgi:hypothetical protein